MTTLPFDSAPEARLAPEALAWDERGLVPAVVQDARTGEVLTLAYMNRESLARTLETGETWFWSRSRRALWHKGETSGHVQRVDGLVADCDADALVVRVTPTGPACHTGASTCFHQSIEGAPDGRADESLGAALDALLATIAARKATLPEGSYTTYLFRAGLNKVLKKVGEEATEVVVAAKEPDDDALAGEVADLLYHLGVLLHARGLDPAHVAAKLAARRRPEGAKQREG
ncbi:MAG: bifunctional phosphoribosyl-AMP cyclohydrolase/phosphoribosyl-ATP diphosphatase HisIE [Planctomycetota bacterium]|nr:bifunctional phosphoribosyl-AMP cyclohydrolase/phosphoribosyl-ATP diphosphatase HisIE [Planctomycetota bacterium]